MHAPLVVYPEDVESSDEEVAVESRSLGITDGLSGELAQRWEKRMKSKSGSKKLSGFSSSDERESSIGLIMVDCAIVPPVPVPPPAPGLRSVRVRNRAREEADVELEVQATESLVPEIDEYLK